MAGRILIDSTPRPDFSDLVPPGVPTNAISWRGDAGLNDCGCGCGECSPGCGCSGGPFASIDAKVVSGAVFSHSNGQSSPAPPPPLDFLPLVPEAGVDEGLQVPVNPRGLDCYATWLDWLDTLDPIARAAAEEQGSGCFPWTITRVVTDASVFLGYAPITPPSTWGSDCCDWTVVELEANCPPPPIGFPTMPTAADRGRFAEYVSIDVEGGCGRETPGCPFVSTARQLIEDAWALLHLNLDLVEWAVCVGYCGAMNVGDVPRHEVRWRCLQDQLYGVGTQLSIQVDCGDEYPLGEPVAWVYSLDAGHSLRGYPDYTYIHDSIHFYAPQEGSHFEDVVENYCTGSYETKVCLAVYIASVLLHEMAHTCGASYFDGGGAPCRASYLIDQTFLWAMLNRYPAGLLSGCCDQWRANNLVNPYTGRMGPVDELFMSDGNNIQQKVDC